MLFLPSVVLVATFIGLANAAKATNEERKLKLIDDDSGRLGHHRELSAVAEKANVVNFLETNFGNDPAMKAKFLRLGFHDCVGGCDGCVDLSEPDNNGLELPIDELAPIAASVQTLTRADVWALAATWSAETMQVPATAMEFPFNLYGRVDCGGVEMAKAGPIRQMPSTEFTTHEITNFFAENFDFSIRETVVIMGAHSVGAAAVTNSGYDGPNGWDTSNDVLDNDYYHQLVGKVGQLDNAPAQGTKWHQVEIDNSELPDIGNEVQWVRDTMEVGEIFMLHADVALVRNNEGLFNENDDGFVTCSFFGGNVNNRCPMATTTIDIMSEYREDEALWVEDFRDTLAKLLSAGHTCDFELCA